MSGPAAVVTIAGLLTLCGCGVLATLGHARTRRELAGTLALAPLAGMAWAGIVGATLTVVEWRLGLVGLAFLTVVTCVVGGARMSRRAVPAPSPLRPRRTTFDKVVVIGALTALVVVLVDAISVFRIKPLAEYDGWAMWGMKARALATLGGADPALFASRAYERLHLEYPLLLPSLHALPLQAASGFASNTVVLSCLAVGLAGLLAIWGLLRDRVRPSLLLAFVAALATMPAFFGQLATGYADVPVAMFVAAGAVTAARWLLDDRRSWLALATLFLAAAALTKNEGLLYAAAVYTALVAGAAGRRKAAALSAGIVALAYAPWRAYVAVHDLGAPDYNLSSSFNLPWVAGRLDRGPEAETVSSGRCSIPTSSASSCSSHFSPSCSQSPSGRGGWAW